MERVTNMADQGEARQNTPQDAHQDAPQEPPQVQEQVQELLDRAQKLLDRAQELQGKKEADQDRPVRVEVTPQKKLTNREWVEKELKENRWYWVTIGVGLVIGIIMQIFFSVQGW